MRRAERELKVGETLEALLTQAQVGRVATINQQGYPVIKPVNFLFWGGKIYVHSSQEGEKMNDLRRGSPVCFEIDQPIAYVPAREATCGASFYYRSVVIKGKASSMEDPKGKLEILERLMEKYQPGHGDAGIQTEILNRTAIVEIVPDEITGKENLG